MYKRPTDDAFAPYHASHISYVMPLASRIVNKARPNHCSTFPESYWVEFCSLGNLGKDNAIVSGTALNP